MKTSPNSMVKLIVLVAVQLLLLALLILYHEQLLGFFTSENGEVGTTVKPTYSTTSPENPEPTSTQQTTNNATETPGPSESLSSDQYELIIPQFGDLTGDINFSFSVDTNLANYQLETSVTDISDQINTNESTYIGKLEFRDKENQLYLAFIFDKYELAPSTLFQMPPVTELNDDFWGQIYRVNYSADTETDKSYYYTRNVTLESADPNSNFQAETWIDISYQDRPSDSEPLQIICSVSNETLTNQCDAIVQGVEVLLSELI